MDVARKLLIAGWACFGVTVLILIISVAVLSINANGKVCPVPPVCKACPECKKCPECKECPECKACPEFLGCPAFFYNSSLDSSLVCNIGEPVSFSPNTTNMNRLSTFSWSCNPELGAYGLAINGETGVISGTVTVYQDTLVKLVESWQLTFILLPKLPT